MSDHSTHSHGNMNQLMTGFVLAAILTVIPFGIILGEPDISRMLKIGIIMGFGALQIIVHLVYFLHVNRSSEGGWTIAATLFAVIILVIVLAGSLWVMHNMNENMMPMPDMDKMMSLQSQQG
ncbi:cytochrome o ubiquinol oxidase subunit IV [Pseudooceanicola sediminis]|uniref:Cytochrome bo(3) ubiquinol oxidase subunit 4 n=1 Tax=Pseudooceanicola sediminis TaxID=2211117 RepID=A0A399J4Y8_9RHOB|nr:cytochrome o ubiquinol oxidase subunit IV [Pseudooceanicola sediminis]KAA2317196.1 cytochrome o ubiquinol oxidase subunit IV [Puniceibacterium sp. HSS470]RII40455.1 cytochrome o ubiquinol oxidase subunit IV [Pseudooceanicola sediminis]|tara:strand:- start:30257 stop:30622 length:366 start_codon:yes stop_codon:yes gene_type:complete